MNGHPTERNAHMEAHHVESHSPVHVACAHRLQSRARSQVAVVPDTLGSPSSLSRDSQSRWTSRLSCRASLRGTLATGAKVITGRKSSMATAAKKVMGGESTAMLVPRCANTRERA